MVGSVSRTSNITPPLYYEMHDEVVPALRLFEECGKTERIKNLLIRNARMNPGNGHYYELRRYYFNMDEREIEDSPVLMAGMSMLHSMLMDDEKSEYWYEKLKAFATNAKGGVRREALSRLAYLDIGLPHRGSRDVLEIIKKHPRPAVRQGQPPPGVFRHQQPPQHHERRQGFLPLEPV